MVLLAKNVFCSNKHKLLLGSDTKDLMYLLRVGGRKIAAITPSLQVLLYIHIFMEQWFSDFYIVSNFYPI